jgi:LUD domain
MVPMVPRLTVDRRNANPGVSAPVRAGRTGFSVHYARSRDSCRPPPDPYRRLSHLFTLVPGPASTRYTPEAISLRAGARIAGVLDLVRSGPGWVLIDTTWPGRGRLIKAVAESMFGAGACPEAIVLTHIHRYHSCSALELARMWDLGHLSPDLPFTADAADRGPPAAAAAPRPGLKLVELPDAEVRCGFGGTLALKNSEVSGVGHLRGTQPFPAAAGRALADTQLRANLAMATATIGAKRAAVVAELADWEELRAAGQAAKAGAMRHLDRYLEQLETRVRARGGTVHWARDAIEANQGVAGLVRGTGSREVIKVKSMVTDEIGLNEALAAAGITAHETDLAELIVQLGHDRPSHILVPAIHRNRAEIREIFLREMPGVDPALSGQPAALAEAARLHLRRKFLSARGPRQVPVVHDPGAGRQLPR